MASNRSNVKSRCAAQPVSAVTPKEALAAVARQTAVEVLVDRHHHLVHLILEEMIGAGDDGVIRLSSATVSSCESS